MGGGLQPHHQMCYKIKILGSSILRNLLAMTIFFSLPSTPISLILEMDRTKRIFKVEQQQPDPSIPVSIPNIVEYLEEAPTFLTGSEAWKEFCKEYNEAQRRINDFIYRTEIKVRGALNQNYNKWESFRLDVV